uniref:Uncharacterized protein n=1 Tax=Rhizophora mucronata TaxID=61149 RepID=A0A2P2N0J4_RHIMU
MVFDSVFFLLLKKIIWDRVHKLYFLHI